MYASATIGSSGAVTLVSRTGIASITKNGTGDYSLVLQDRYSSLKFAQIMVLDDTAQDMHAQIYSEDVAGSTKTIRFLTLAGASPAHPANGAKLLIKIEVKNTDVI